MMLCCGTTIDVVGVAGTILLLTGLTEMAAGVYFMLTLPIFEIASNIWTGVMTGFAGSILMYYGSTNQTRRRSHVILSLTVITLVTSIINLVIVQAGENGAFLSKKSLKIIEIRGTSLHMEIAIWLTTAASALGMACAFFVAQFVFCSQLRPRFKAKKTHAESLKMPFDANRFFPPSRLAGPKGTGAMLPSILPLPDHANASTTAAWVYSPEDKLSSGLYPMAIEMHPDILENTRRPIRHSSFAGPRYARVVQRPQRAQSFATRRDPFSIHGDEFPRLQPVAVPRLPRTFGNERLLKRSTSFTAYASDAAATLSHKYRAFSLCRNDAQVLEIGSLLGSASEHGLANALTDPPISSSFLQTVREVSISRAESTHENSQGTANFKEPMTRLVHRQKGPAPQPPLPRLNSSGKEIDDVKIPLEIIETQMNKVESEEDDSNKYCTCSDSCDEKETDSDEQTFSPPYVHQVNIEDNNRQPYSNKESQFLSSTPKCEDTKGRSASLDRISLADSPLYEALKQNRTTPAEIPIEPLKLPSISLLKEIAQNAKFWNALKNSKFAKYQNFDNSEWKKLENFLKLILDKSETKPEQLLHSPVDKKPDSSPKLPESPKTLGQQPLHLGNYEEAHKEVTEDYATLLERLPSNEVQRNKIILRVPSFKTTGCQTEAYRPIRRRASCTQGPTTISPKYLVAQSITKRKPIISSNGIEVQMNGMTCSSSSGYSSPDGDSKGGSPMHSGPPSPGSVSETASNKRNSVGGANVTIIEVNRPCGYRVASFVANPPARPPKPVRMRYFSDVSLDTKRIAEHTLAHQNKYSVGAQTYDETFGLATLAENVMLLAEAINPVLVEGNHITTVPRIVDVIRKKTLDHAQSRLVRADTFTQDDRQSPLDTNTQLLRINSLTLPRIQSHYPRNRLPDIPSRSPSPQADDDTNQVEFNQNIIDTSSTAAYLASLELLASHYRQQALANAKQLQLQQQYLLHQHPATEKLDQNSATNYEMIDEASSNSSAEEAPAADYA